MRQTCDITHTVSYIVDIIIPVFNFHHDLSISRVTYLQNGRYTGNITKGEISFVFEYNLHEVIGVTRKNHKTHHLNIFLLLNAKHNTT
jgi:hypothetical protein